MRQNNLSIDLDLELPRLEKIHDYLWLAGSPKARPLHREKTKRWEFVIIEQTNLHLVWWGNYMLVKPLPRFLLNHKSFQDSLFSPIPVEGQTYTMHTNACGLLLSYI